MQIWETMQCRRTNHDEDDLIMTNVRTMMMMRLLMKSTLPGLSASLNNRFDIDDNHHDVIVIIILNTL